MLLSTQHKLQKRRVEKSTILFTLSLAGLGKTLNLNCCCREIIVWFSWSILFPTKDSYFGQMLEMPQKFSKTSKTFVHFRRYSHRFFLLITSHKM